MARRSVHQGSLESKQAILEAVLMRALETGYEGTTMADIAKAAKLPIGSLYWHFQNKEQLFAELLDYCFTMWRSNHDNLETLHDFLSQSLTGSAAASRDSTDPAAAFWSVGLIFALERRLAGNAARERYLAIRADMYALAVQKIRAQIPLDDDAAATAIAAELAVVGRALTDGFRIAAAAGDDVDFAHYARLSTEAFEQMIQTRVKEYTDVNTPAVA